MKRVPIRRCAWCGEHEAKGALLRVARSPQGVVALDLKGKAPGRGAYVHAEKSCLENAIAKGRLDHTLKVRLSPEERAQLLSSIHAAAGVSRIASKGEEQDHG